VRPLHRKDYVIFQMITLELFLYIQSFHHLRHFLSCLILNINFAFPKPYEDLQEILEEFRGLNLVPF
jgi:hypothetical protein